MKYTRESSELQSLLPINSLPVPGEKLNIILMCVVPLMVPTLRSTEHIKKLHELQFFKMYMMFYFTAT
jgi:hypothetical protein